MERIFKKALWAKHLGIATGITFMLFVVAHAKKEHQTLLRVQPSLNGSATPIPPYRGTYTNLALEVLPQPKMLAEQALFWGMQINLNDADMAALDRIPGIGLALAQRILDRRAKLGRFTSWQEVDAVSGIGPVVLTKLKAAFRL